MVETFEVPVGEGIKVKVKKRFPSTAIARLGERAPKITGAVTEHLLDDEKRQALALALAEAETDEERDAIQRKYDHRQSKEFIDQGLELVRAPIAELDALHDFCVTVTHEVEGARKLDGGVLAWSDADEETRKAFYDCDVPTLTKLTIYVFCWMLKNGIDPGVNRDG